MERVRLPLAGVKRAVNRNALEGAVQVQPRTVSGFDVDRAGGYAATWARGTTIQVSLSEPILSYSPDAMALLANSHVLIDGIEYDQTAGSIAGKHTYLAPRVGAVANPLVQDADVYESGAFFKDSLGSLGDLNRVSGLTITESGTSGSVAAGDYRFMVIVEAPTSIGWLAYQVLTADHTSSGVDDVTITLDSTLPLGYAVRAYWWPRNAGEPSFFQIGASRFVSDGGTIAITFDDSTATGDPSTHALMAFSSRLVEPHRQRIWGVAAEQAFVGPFAAGLSAEKYFTGTIATSSTPFLTTPDSGPLDAGSALSFVMPFQSGVTARADGQTEPTGPEWTDTSPGGEITAMAAYGDGGVVVSYGDRLRRYRADGSSVFNVSVGTFSEVTDIKVDDDGDIYYCTGSAVRRANPSNGATVWGSTHSTYGIDLLTYDATYIYTVERDSTSADYTFGARPTKWDKATGNEVWTGSSASNSANFFRGISVDQDTGRVACWVGPLDDGDNNLCYVHYWTSGGTYDQVGGCENTGDADLRPQIYDVTHDGKHRVGQERFTDGGAFYAWIDGSKEGGPDTRFIGVGYNKTTGDKFAIHDTSTLRAFRSDGTEWSYNVSTGGTLAVLAADDQGGIFLGTTGGTVEKISTLHEWRVVLSHHGPEFEAGIRIQDLANAEQEARFYVEIDGDSKDIGAAIPDVDGNTVWNKGDNVTLLKGRTLTVEIDLTDGTGSAVLFTVSDPSGSGDFTRSSSVSSYWPGTFPATGEVLAVADLDFNPDLTMEMSMSFFEYALYHDLTQSTVVAIADADDYSPGSNTFTSSGPNSEIWTLDTVVAEVQGGTSTVSTSLPAKNTVVYTGIREVNTGNYNNYVFLDYQNSPSGVTGLASTPAGVVAFGENETFLLRGDPTPGQNFEIVRAFGMFGNDNGVIPGRLGGVVFPIWKGRVYAISLGMGDVDFGTGIEDISDPVFNPEDPFVQVVGEPRSRQVIARTKLGEVYRYSPSKEMWFTDVWSEHGNLKRLLPNPSTTGVRYVIGNDLYFANEEGGDAFATWEDVDLGDKNQRLLWRRAYMYTNDGYGGAPELDFVTAHGSGTIQPTDEGEGQFVFTFPRGTVAPKMEELTFRLNDAARGDALEAPIEIEVQPRYRRR